MQPARERAPSALPLSAMNSEENVRYVVAGTPTGWAAMAETIRDVDERKVQNYKEDIDTLLVFTGLFSAVLTSFVIGSFPSLSPDKQDTVIQLLSQISNQTSSYTIAANLINSTLPPPSESATSESFVPPSSALLTNYLWFASLVITLVTASLAMLVKSWLREYLAYDYTAPHERLRARQFRYPGLRTWKVYEIAGVLPLLLQLALGLFFLGLCFFTTSDLHGIGDMCAVLVALWASFFLCATIAPAFSPRCPYKTTLLKRVMIPVRRGIKCIVIVFHRYLGQPICSGLVHGSLLVLSTMPSFSYPLPHKRYTPQPEGISFVAKAREFFTEEEQVIKGDVDELALLKEVDAFHLDDDLLGTTILESLMEYNTSPASVIDFAIHALNLRLKGGALAQPLKCPPDLRRLTRRGWVAVSNIVAGIVLSSFPRDAPAMCDWMQDAIYLLLAMSDQPLTSCAGEALVHCCQKATLDHIIRTLSMSGPFPPMTSRFHDVVDPMVKRLQELPPEDVTNFILGFIAIEARPAATPCRPLKSALDLRPLSQSTWRLCSDALGATILRSLDGPDSKSIEIGSWLEDVVRILLSPSSYSLTRQAIDALGRVLTSGSLFARLGSCIRSLASPNNDGCIHTLKHLREFVAYHCTDWLLPEIAHSIPCTSQCTHGSSYSGGPLALLLSEHGPRYPDWTRNYLSILIERCRLVLRKDSWPTGSLEAIRALMSFPILHDYVDPGIPQVLLKILGIRMHLAAAVECLVSVDPKMRGRIVSDNSVRCITSLIEKADTEDRRKFIQAMAKGCDEYAAGGAKSNAIKNINAMRHITLASKVHIHIRLDDNLTGEWTKYYKSCAKAMSIFRANKYLSLPDDEKVHTVRLAEKCLVNLDSIEPTPSDFQTWLDNFDAGASAFPDEIFLELLEFIGDSDVGAIARRCKRVRRLRPDVPTPVAQHITATVFEDEMTSNMTVEPLESLASDDGGSRGNERSPLDARPNRPTSHGDEQPACVAS